MQLRGRDTNILICQAGIEERSALETAAKLLGYAIEVVPDGASLLSRLVRPGISAALLDISISGHGSFDTIREIRQLDPQLPVLVVASDATPGDIVAAMKSGADDFLCGPITDDQLQVALDSAFQRRNPVSSLPPGHTAPLRSKTFSGHSPRILEICSLIPFVGQSDAPVLIQGETGSGKEVLARELHLNSARAAKVFLKLNCAALPPELVESELFGYERGAFTGAFQRRAGMFELAGGGTLLLDEIGDMDVRLQAKLLQVLQDKEFLRIGGKETIKVDVRVLAATHRDLEAAVLNGSFREDLYYRLNVINIEVPPLRERREDILPLTEFLLNKHTLPGSQAPIVTSNLRYALTTYHWPGNIRELENIARRLIVLRNADLVASELLAKAARKRLGHPTSGRTPGNPEPQKSHVSMAPTAPILEQVTKAKHQAEAEAILAALHATRWNRKQAAVLLQIDYKALLYKLRKLGLEDKPATVDASFAGMNDRECNTP